MLSIPIVLWAIYEASYVFASAVFLVAAISDGVDGYIARRFSQKTVLGSFLDPIADKLLLTLTFIILTASPNTLVAHPAWLTVAVTYRDLMILFGCGMVKWFIPTLEVRPIVASKLTTFFQIVTILTVCLANLLESLQINAAAFTTPIHVLSVITGLFCLISVLGYYRAGIRILMTEGEEPARERAVA
jgi:cardiolipin synthase